MICRNVTVINWHSNNNTFYCCQSNRQLIAGLSIRFEVGGEIVKVDGTGGRRPPHRRVVWGPPRPPAGYRGRAPLGVQGANPPEAK